MSYEEALRGLDVQIVVSEYLGSYQGDWVALIREEEWGSRFGFVVIGYGSCGGCDAWQACMTLTERADLIAELVKDIKWYETLEQAQAYITDSHNRDLEWYAHETEWADFQARVSQATHRTIEAARS